ncbi:MAG: energy-coupling factor ABC transporter permease [Armatimonadota bacterium]
MSHIHLPDGILPAWLWLSGYALTVILISILWRWGKAVVEPRKFALLGIFSAIMVVAATIELPPFAYHINLSVVAAIVLGPQSAVLAALMVNVILALIGHGGITVIGLNVLLMSVEMLVGFYVFRLLRKLRTRIYRAGFVSTICGLFTGTVAGFAVIAVGSPWINRFLQSAGGDEELGPGIEGAQINLARMAVIMLATGLVGWVLEGVISAAILDYLGKIYPELVDGQEE